MKMNEMSRSEEKNYKLVDLIKFICAFLVIGIHTRQFLSVSDIADRLFYYDVSNYSVATVYKGNIIKNLIMDCQSYTKYRPNETTGGIFVSWRRKEELPTGA